MEGVNEEQLASFVWVLTPTATQLIKALSVAVGHGRHGHPFSLSFAFFGHGNRET